MYWVAQLIKSVNVCGFSSSLFRFWWVYFSHQRSPVQSSSSSYKPHWNLWNIIKHCQNISAWQSLHFLSYSPLLEKTRSSVQPLTSSVWPLKLGSALMLVVLTGLAMTEFPPFCLSAVQLGVWKFWVGISYQKEPAIKIKLQNFLKFFIFFWNFLTMFSHEKSA